MERELRFHGIIIHVHHSAAPNMPGDSILIQPKIMGLVGQMKIQAAHIDQTKVGKSNVFRGSADVTWL